MLGKATKIADPHRGQFLRDNVADCFARLGGRFYVGLEAEKLTRRGNSPEPSSGTVGRLE